MKENNNEEKEGGQVIRTFYEPTPRVPGKESKSCNMNELFTMLGKAFAGIIIICVILLAGSAISEHWSPQAPVQVPAQVPTIAPTPVPTPAPEVIGPFTISGLTEAGGIGPEVLIKEDHRLFSVSYESYDRLQLGDIVYFTISGSYNPYGTEVYRVSSVNIVSYGYPNYLDNYNNYPTYYHYQNHYYQYDGRMVDPMTIKQVRNEYVIEGHPPTR